MNVIPNFDHWGVKTVGPNDITKAAFVPLRSQTAALGAAGIAPEHGASFNINILFDPAVSLVEASYYHSVREGSGRTPEPRMGRRFVSGWLQPGDEVVIGNIGSKVFAYKVTPLSPLPGSASQPAGGAVQLPQVPLGTTTSTSSSLNTPPPQGTSASAGSSGVPGGSAGPLGSNQSASAGGLASGLGQLGLWSAPASERDIAEEIVRTEDPAAIMAQARMAAGAPGRRTVARDDFTRNTYVVAGALLRANGKCEMPGCTHPLFLKDDGRPYLEVHHIVPLGEGGDDTLVNAASLCPHCHRRLHFGADRIALRSPLVAHIASIT